MEKAIDEGVEGVYEELQAPADTGWLSHSGGGETGT